MTLDTLTLRSPDALLASIPYLVGFTPRDSVVVVWLRAGSITLTQRMDWPVAEARRPWLAALLAPRATTPADEVVVVLIDDDPSAPGALTADQVGRAVRRECRAVGLPLRDVLHQRGDGWRSLLCRDPGCCPDDGRTVPESVRLAVGAEFAAAGHAPLAGRDDVVASLQADPETVARLAASVTGARRGSADLESWRDASLAVITDALRGQPGDGGHASGVAVASLGDIRVRDTVLWDITTGAVEVRERARDLLLEALRGSPPSDVAPVATVFAVVAWLLGDGARAGIAIERALAADDAYSLAHLLRHGLESGLPPQHWAEAMRGLSREECRHGR